MKEGGRPLCKCHGKPKWKSGKKWTCSVKASRRSRRYRKEHPERTRKGVLRSQWKRIGINPDLAFAALANHNGKCDICGTTEPGGRYGWNLDHDKLLEPNALVRGVLC